MCSPIDNYGWNVRSLYEQPPPDLMEAEAFFAAFARFHDIDGHKIECIYTKAKRQPIHITHYDRDTVDGVTAITSVLIVRDEDMSGMEQGASLKVDGTYCRIMRISKPITGLVRMELEGYAG